MTMPWTHGAVHYPLPAATTNTLLRDADPTIYFLLHYFTWCINHYVGSRLVAQAQLAEFPEIDSAVRSTSSLNPAPYLAESGFQFPLLALYRTQSVFTERTMVRRQDASTLVLAYVLPPLTASQAEQLVPILNAVKGLLDRVAISGRDDAYTPPDGAAGESIFSPDYAGLTQVMCSQASFGAFGGTGDLHFPAITMTVNAIESASVDLSGLPPFTGATANIALQDSNGTTPNAAVSKTDLPLTLTSVSPASGPRAGGQVATIVTQNARPGTTVLFGGQHADVLEVADDGTSVTVRTPALAAHYPDNFPASITIAGTDTQADRLPAAYTYVA